MKHNEIDTGMLRAYLDGEVNAERMSALSEHMGTCADCQAELKALKSRALSVGAGLDYLPRAVVADGAAA